MNGMWRAALVEALDDRIPGHGISAETFRPALRERYPWHDWKTLHRDWSPGEWWTRMERVLTEAYRGIGIEDNVARELGHLAHQRYVDPASFQVFADTIPVLETLKADGWSHIILSNHVPELPDMVQGLGLGNLFEAILSSGNTGVEKPHPEAYRLGRKTAGNPDKGFLAGIGRSLPIEPETN